MQITDTGVTFTFAEMGLSPNDANNHKFLLKGILENFYRVFEKERGSNLSLRGGGVAQLLSFPKNSQRWTWRFDLIMTPQEEKQYPSLGNNLYGVDGIYATEKAELQQTNNETVTTSNETVEQPALTGGVS